MYRQVSLPLRTMATDSTAATSYLTEGSNRIAVALIAANSAQTTAQFDAALRVMGDASMSRVFDYTVTSSGISGSPSYVMNQYYGYSMSSTSCADNSFQITFDNDRREWVSSVIVYLYYNQADQQPKQFVLQARNSGDAEWTTLRTVTGMAWSQLGEHKKIWVENNKPWNQYRFQNFDTGDSQDCTWQLGGVDLLAERFLAQTPDLMYDTPVVVRRDTHMTPLYPNSQHYYDFSITPSLPSFLQFDASTGVIRGAALSPVPKTRFVIHGQTTTSVVNKELTLEFVKGVNGTAAGGEVQCDHGSIKVGKKWG